jgi:3-oxoacyl-[acyl-carrier-protein] synthase-3
MNDVYINQLFTVLPNRPVSNDEIDNYLGLIGGEVSRVKKIVLGRNGIKQRYYALTEEGRIHIVMPN